MSGLPAPAPRTVTLWRIVNAEWIDPWGNKLDAHEVLDMRVLFESETTYDHDNGYSVDQLKIWQSTDGLRAVQVPPIDYGASSWWLELVDFPRGHRPPGRWVEKPRSQDKRRFLCAGEPINTP